MAEQRKRVVKRAVVVRTERLTPAMIRVVFTGTDLAGMSELEYTDHYIKILFPPAGADYTWPFDPDAIRLTHPPELWSVTRTYTVRSYDAATNELAVDFVVHGDEGLAGPWAASAEPGAEIGFFGPGGGYAPDPQAHAHLLIGDEAAIPAIAAALERVPADVPAQVFLEVGSVSDHQALPESEATNVTWVHRGGKPYGLALAEAVRGADLTEGDVQVFVHGNADMVRDLRRFFFVERRCDRERVSISGYWRTGHTEDRWQSSKRDFNEQMEAEEQVALAAG
ncbi:MAG TPA: siderophore-interacting protein [Propionibacteriaceae bacterium]